MVLNRSNHCTYYPIIGWWHKPKTIVHIIDLMKLQSQYCGILGTYGYYDVDIQRMCIHIIGAIGEILHL